MSLYVNKLRYNESVPVFGKSAGTHYSKMYYGDTNVLGVENVQPPQPINYEAEYFTITSWEDNNDIYYKTKKGTGTSGVDMYYSTNKTTWTKLDTYYSAFVTIVTLNKGDSVWFKGTNDSLGANDSGYVTSFSSSKYAEASGNIMSLLYGDDFIGKTTANGAYTFIDMFNAWTKILSARNLIMPCTTYYQWIYQGTFTGCTNLIYAPKELPQQTYQGRNTLIWMFSNCTKLEETPIIRLTGGSLGDNWFNYICQGDTIKRAIFLCTSGYPSANGNATIKYKLSWNTSVSGSAYRNFDTLQDNNQFISIWAETETLYDGIIKGCSDHFIQGDSVTLEYISINGTFNGYYDENDNLLSSSSTYTFTAQRNMKIKVKTT